MPIVSRFLGIIITMYWSDHSPPHFHAKYGEYEIIVTIDGGVVEGKFPKRALKHVLEWLDLHQEELLENWRCCQRREPLKEIAPLE
ncbi:DUF4160 domain-containing protein [Methylobacter tundripaludum]|jgi:hypothetical protein|uniref:Transcriptional regulator n=1 Tax=Methylobacter tundripaludum (strain ATCC BAA-1195 / DSM 17260 / SV96) TaxID=697282 RepID=G3IX75_METTV|nr:DUF4160 domain-containing protein [Methylobacter tundripaludum]EGW22012.1 hypothetical protein Mettu_0807 [Methylobacter tundripaludum SV96]